ncbi:DUF2235 domain-containing protein [Chimaeribacter arupi]|uniref:T6SS phospholipase effector Tle1-like catalytic domain-containing protein n=1 Tax=Chimaeribacter arupi TaxID=2060066 RepID=UPI002711D9D0|nr:DUF2235 domain-containing protein [Chimaeribacter arupi]WKZ90776.1 DUF2235 domain-containing protein [Chimaeribacter arupi]
MAQYTTWEITDGQHTTNMNVSEKVVVCKRKEVPGMTLTIGMFFDGTGNNVFNTDKRLLGTCTNMDVGISSEDAESCAQKLDIDMDHAGSYLGYYSNIHWLNTLYETDEEIKAEKYNYQVAVYVQGIGTAKDEEDSLVSMGLGTLFEGVVAKTNEGVSLISEQIERIINKGEDISFAIEKIQFDVFGFSRGAAAARHFANRVLRGDNAIQQAINKGLNGRNHHGKPAGEVRFLGLFDTVCAVGSVTDLFNVHDGVNPGVELALPSGVAQQVFQITAMHECRYNFSLNSIKDSWPELALPGVHSDIGGGYNPSEREHLFLTKPAHETVDRDLPIEKTGIYQRAVAALPDLQAAPNLCYILPTGKVKVESWYDYLVNPDKQRKGITEKRVGAAVTLARMVPNDWSKVTLRVMLDAAKEAGVIFNPIRDANLDLKLADELKPLSQKAIEQGKAVRNGGALVPFTHEELLLIGKYMHCSANWNPVKFKGVWLDGKQVRTIYGAVPFTQVIGFVNIPNPEWKRSVWNRQGEKA